MNEVQRKARARYFEREIWNNLSKQNSFEDRRLNLKRNKLGKDENIAVKSWNQEQLLMLRRNKKLHELLNGSHEHFTQKSNQLIPPSTHISLPSLGAQQRPRSTSSSAQGSTDFSSRSKEPARPRSHTEQMLSAKTEHSVRKQSAQEEISLPSVSETKVRRTTHSAFSQNTSLSSSEPFMQRKTSWTRPSTQIHRRNDITSLYD
ncbi:hypothetical protein pdam_00015126 [Pocillopora damicornis]|uniref:Uncharacterized protein n=1 Tax=Pocillopora damicornis TaxID=46731 RepID=A0A3M6U1S7_POCDA|nr:hypothetical protein pdam_00015126 [Pocillopora damicornis]